METNGSICNSHESQPSDASDSTKKDKPTEKVVFINHAEIAWQAGRGEWVGDQAQKSQRVSSEPVISWTTTYEDLLLTAEPFQEPIPLAEMVDFLVDIWLEEGLYD